MNKKANHTFPILDLIAERWSPRSFKTEDVPVQKIQSLFEAARWCSSAFNDQPWRYIVGNKKNPTWNAIFDCLNEGNREWNQNVPLLILVCCETHSPITGKTNPYASFDTGQSMATLCQQAQYLGLHTHPMAGFHKEKAREFFQLPSTIEPLTVLAVGYLDTPNKLSEKYMTAELSERKRRGFSEFVFFEKYNQPLEMF